MHKQATICFAPNMITIRRTVWIGRALLYMKTTFLRLQTSGRFLKVTVKFGRDEILTFGKKLYQVCVI